MLCVIRRELTVSYGCSIDNTHS